MTLLQQFKTAVKKQRNGEDMAVCHFLQDNMDELELGYIEAEKSFCFIIDGELIGWRENKTIVSLPHIRHWFD